jgi:tetratricopeptide (TPR) repeat protein
MIPRSLPRILAVGWLILGAHAGAAQTLDDTAARAHLEWMERSGVLREPVWAHAYWARSVSAPNDDARIADLRWALRFDPDLTAARWELCRALARTRDPEFATEALGAASSSLRSFVAQQRAIAWIFTILAGSFALAAIAVAAITIGSAAGPIRHGMRERLHFLPVELRAGASWLTLLVPFALVTTLAPTAALFWSILIGTVAAWPGLAPWQRRACGWALGVMLLAPTGLALWTRIMEPALPTSYLGNLWASQRVGGEALYPSWWTGAREDAEGDPDFLASLALIARRGERYEEAIAHLQRAIELRPDAWQYHNNLGNVHLLRGSYESALASYAAALQLAPSQPLIHVNLAQAHVQGLHFGEADQALARAKELGYRLPAVLNDESEGIIVCDHALSSPELWIRFLRGQGLEGSVDWRRVLRATLTPIFPMQPFWMSLPLLLTLWYASQTRSLPRSFPCSACGHPVCRKCHYRILRRSLCADCYAIRRDVAAPMKRDAMILERRIERNRSPRIRAAVLSALMPGAGHLLLGSYRVAFPFLGAGCLLLLIALANATWPAPGPSLIDRRWPTGVVVPLLFFGLLAILAVRSYLRAPAVRPAESAAPLPEPAAASLATRRVI